MGRLKRLQVLIVDIEETENLLLHLYEASAA